MLPWKPFNVVRLPVYMLYDAYIIYTIVGRSVFIGPLALVFDVSSCIVISVSPLTARNFLNLGGSDKSNRALSTML